MTALRSLSQAVGIAVLAGLGVLLFLEASEVVTGRWRRDLASAIEESTFPGWGLWISGLVGAALALVGIAMIAAQLAPPKKGLNAVHEIYSGNDGETRIRGRAAIGAVRHELETIEGVVAVAARAVKKTMHVDLEVDDRSNLTDIENEARGRLDHEFWINLGLADFAVNLLVTHHPNPPRVR